jgi:eukaryotic-like serine/threonine-protein kinase
MADSKSNVPPDDETRLPASAPDEGETLVGTQTPPGSPQSSTSAFTRSQILAGRFRILRFVARGGMGEVYEADDLELNERVALKTVRFEMAHDEKSVERFKREIQLARKVTHANVCRTYDVFRHVDVEGEKAGRETLVVSMEFLRGTTLSQQIKLDGRMKPAVALPIVEQMAAGLEAAHAAGVVHRDFKSANVILVPSPNAPGGTRAVITDFGLAHGVTGNLASLTGSLDVVGTPDYMSPEQLEGGEVSGATDTYALGIVIFEMLTGSVPFKGSNAISTALKRLTEPAPSPRSVVKDLDERWEQVVLRCFEREPARRFAATIDVGEALRGRAVSDAPRPTKSDRKQVQPAAPPGKYLAWGAIAVFVVLVALGFATLRSKFSRDASAPPATQTAGAAAGDNKPRPSIAILGFQNLSSAPDAAVFGDILSDSLWSQLDLEEVRFISPSRVDEMLRDLSIKDVKQDPGKDQLRRIGDYLGSDVVVAGSYRVTGEKSAQNIDWNLHLLRTADGSSLGSVQQSGPSSNVNQLAARAGELIRGKLGIELSTQEESRLDSSFSTNPEALRYFAAAREKLRNFDLQAAIQLLTKGVVADPKFAQPHVALAEAWAALGFETRAQEEAQRALDLSTSMSVQGKGFANGRFYETKHDWSKAVEQYASLWAVYRDNPEYGLLLANSQTNAGKASQALLTLAEVRKLKISAQLSAQADLLESEAQEATSNFDKQLAAATAAGEKAKSLDAKLLLARARILQCGALLNQGKSADAKPDCDEARRLNQEAGDTLGTARATNEVANAYWRSGDYSSAKPLYEQALGMAQTIGDRRDEAGAILNLANISDAQGDEAAAERGYRQSIAVANARGSQGDLALALQNLAVILYAEGKRKEGAESFQQAIKIAQQIGDRKTEARALNNRCSSLLGDGDVAAAKQSCEQSLKLRRDVGDQGDVARSLGGTGDVLFAQGDVAGAEQSYREALRIQEQLGQKQDAAATRVSLAYWSLEGNNLEEGRKCATDAAAFFADAKDSADEANAHLALAEISLKGDNEARAKSEIERARTLASPGGDATLKLRINVMQARIDARWNRANAAIESLKSAAIEATKTGDVALGLEVRVALGEAQDKAGSISEARATFASASRDAKAKGFGLLATKADDGIRKLVATKAP